MSNTTWWIYILKCRDGTLYTGCTPDLDKRVRTHNNGAGARYTRSRLPVELLYKEATGSQSAALIREAGIKKLTRAEKLKLIGV